MVVNPDRDDVVLVPTDGGVVEWNGVYPVQVPLPLGNVLALAGVLADQLPIQEDLVSIVDPAQLQPEGFLEVGTVLQGRRDDHVDPVPGVAVIARVALFLPGFANGYGFPATVVESGRGPGGVVAGMEFPVVGKIDLGVEPEGKSRSKQGQQ